LQIKEETILICSVGNFVTGRNQLLICKFAKLLKASNVNFKLVFVGQKNEDKFPHYKDSYSFCEVNNLLNEVSFLGSRSDIDQILKCSDAFIYSSGHDSFGIAVIEALYSMNNVFLNDWPVMREISNDGTFATIFATNDENDLFSKFNSNFEENKHISQTEKVKFLMANFSIEQHLLGLEKIYKNLSK
jgi:glycosyltransferase involved in cell wall biosynthesis